MSLDKTWFTEICEESGTAFSVKIRDRLHSEKSAFQTIDIYSTEEYGNMMVIDGYIMLTDRDNLIYHEMLAHVPLFTHKNPRQVAIIGGGDCGTLKQVLKHDRVEQATLVEIDEQVYLCAKKYFPVLTQAAGDRRARIVHQDGIAWMKKASGLDVIIVDSTDPIGPAVELFSEGFYKSCFDALNPGGILIQQSESPLYHMNILKPMHKAMQSAGFDSTQTSHFFLSSYPSGWWTATLAARDDSVDLLAFDEQAAANKPFDTFYYNAAMHRASFAAPEFFRREMQQG